MAEHDDLAVGIDGVCLLLELAERDEPGAGNAGGGVLPGLAHVEERYPLAAVQSLRELPRLDLRKLGVRIIRRAVS